LQDPQGRARARYGVQQEGSSYLLRPDQHVCGRWLQLKAAQLRQALEAIAMETPA